MIQNTDIYQTIRTDYDTYFNSMSEIEQKNFLNDHYDTYEWLNDYLEKTLTEADRLAIVGKYGMTKLLQELPRISEDNCWRSYSDFIDDAGADNVYTTVLNHIVVKEVLPELDRFK